LEDRTETELTNWKTGAINWKTTNTEVERQNKYRSNNLEYETNTCIEVISWKTERIQKQ